MVSQAAQVWLNMTIERKLLGTNPSGATAAANVADVFSTHLYTGNGSKQTINNGIALGDTGAGSSVEFNGTTDYLSRSSDLTGNTDSQTFTFSAWIYFTHLEGSSGSKHYIHNGNGMTGYLGNNNTELALYGTDSANGFAYWLQIDNLSPLDGWVNLLVSIDVSDVSKRHVYLDDVLQNPSWNAYDTTKTIDFTSSYWAIASKNDAANKMSGRMTQLFLDHTYRDLSIEANRRLFITSDGQPVDSATLAALSPILYMPLNEDNSIGKNLGTGGDFTVNGSPRTLSTGGPYIGYGHGGIVWIKDRDYSASHGDHVLLSTALQPTNVFRQDINFLIPNTRVGLADFYDWTRVGPRDDTFLSDGFRVMAHLPYNTLNHDYASWTFRNSPKFFQAVTFTYSGSSASPTVVTHNLGCTVGMAISKKLVGDSDWFVQHHSITGANNNGLLNDTGNMANGNGYSTSFSSITDTTATFGATGSFPAGTYIAYFFADNTAEDADEQMIKCGKFQVNGSYEADVTIGWEPQFVLIKPAEENGSWMMFDTMRGAPVGGDTAWLAANLNQAEAYTANRFWPTATGFHIGNYGIPPNTDIIYMAIRAPMMKEPSAATEVFKPTSYTGAGAGTKVDNGFPADLQITNNTDSTANGSKAVFDRLRGGGRRDLLTNTTAAETNGSSYNQNFNKYSNIIESINSNGYTCNNGKPYISYAFKRAKGFFDCVAYTGNSVAGHQISHSLGVVPSMIWAKCRSNGGGAYYWQVYHSAVGDTHTMRLNEANTPAALSMFNNITTTSFKLDNFSNTNGSGETYIAYLFATISGISKVGSYTGNGTYQTINCGFSAGARFVLIKRTDANGDWYVWDTARGIVAGNDPHLSLNTAAATVSSDDSVDPTNSGFIVNQVAATNINVSTATYVFYAIA